MIPASRTSDFRPKYIQLSDRLVSLIEDGEWPAGSLIPSEKELADKYQISRNTVREALKQLEFNGLIYRMRGKGTFIASNRLNQFVTNLTSFSEDVSRLGLQPSHKILGSKRIQAPDVVASRLMVTPRSEVLYLKRLLLANRLPYIITQSYFPVQWLELANIDLSEAQLGDGSLYAFLRSRGIVFERAQLTIRAGLSSTEECKYLELPKGSPVLISERVSFSANNLACEYTIGAGHPDRQQWTTILHSNPSKA